MSLFNIVICIRVVLLQDGRRDLQVNPTLSFASDHLEVPVHPPLLAPAVLDQLHVGVERPMIQIEIHNPNAT